jgi:hypothetical protein
MIAAVLAAAVLAAPAPGLELRLRPPDLRAPRPAAFLARDLAGGGAAAGPEAHGWGAEVAAGATGAVLATGVSFALLAAAVSQLDLPCCAFDSSRTKGTDNTGFGVLALAAAGAEVLLVPLAASLGVKWAGGHGDGEGWRAYGYALGTHALVLGVAILTNHPAIGLPLLLVGDLLLVPLAARAGWHHAPEPPPPGQAPGALSFRF